MSVGGLLTKAYTLLLVPNFLSVSLQKQRTDSVDSGVYSQQSSLEDSQMNSEQGSQPLTCTPSTVGGDGPLEDYTKYNTPLPSVPNKVRMYEGIKV